MGERLSVQALPKGGIINRQPLSSILNSSTTSMRKMDTATMTDTTMATRKIGMVAIKI